MLRQFSLSFDAALQGIFQPTSKVSPFSTDYGRALVEMVLNEPASGVLLRISELQR